MTRVVDLVELYGLMSFFFQLQTKDNLSLSSVSDEMWFDCFSWIRLMLEQDLVIIRYYYNLLSVWAFRVLL